MQRYVVVGGGLAGLTAANALAGEGRSVVLLERSESLGGRAATHQDRGYLMNLGPHALYRGGAAYQTFEQWGIPFHGKSPDASSASFAVHGGRMYPLISTTRGLLTTRLFTAGEKWQAARALQQLLSGGAEEGESMATWLEGRIRAVRVRQFVEMLVRVSTYTADLANLSARAALAQFRHAKRHGVLYLDGGWQTLVDGLEERARRVGVEIRLGEWIENLKSIDADGVVLALPPTAVEQITGRKLPAMQPVRAACLDLCLRELPSGSARIAFGVDQPLYLSVHSAAARLAPEGAALVQMGKYLSGVTEAASDRAELEQLASRAIPGWRERAEIVRFLPHMTVTHASYAPQGRPAVEALGLPGVVLAGDWVGAEGMLADAAVASALRAAGVIQRQKQRAA